MESNSSPKSWEAFEENEKLKLINVAEETFNQIEELATKLGDNPLEDDHFTASLNLDPGWKNISEEGTDSFVVSSKPIQGALLLNSTTKIESDEGSQGFEFEMK